jgi:serine/threonine protein kinase
MNNTYTTNNTNNTDIVNNPSLPLCIDIPTDEDIESTKSIDLLRIEKSLQSISSESESLPSREDSVGHLVGKKLGHGKFSTVSVYTPDSSKVIREAHGFHYVSKFLNYDNENTIEQVENLVTDIQHEPVNMQVFFSLKEIFPLNIIQLFDHFTCKNDQYYQNNYIMERVHGILLSDLVNTDIDLTDVIALFFQAYYITLYANTHGKFHNDLKPDNLMVSNEKYDIILEGLVLGTIQISIKLRNVFILTFIDYGFAREINKTNSIPIETIPIVDMFSSLINACELNHVQNIFKSDGANGDNINHNMLQEFDIFSHDLVELNLASWNKKCINLSPHTLYFGMRKIDEIDIYSIVNAFQNFTDYDPNKIIVNITS